MKPDDLPLRYATNTSGVTVAELVALDGAGNAWVAFECDSETRCAATIVDLFTAQLGARVVVVFERGDALHPIVIGVVRGQGSDLTAQRAPGDVEVSADGRTLNIVAQQELVLRCGSSSICLRRDGRIEIRGETLLMQATGANRIRGGSVQLN